MVFQKEDDINQSPEDMKDEEFFIGVSEQMIFHYHTLDLYELITSFSQ